MRLHILSDLHLEYAVKHSSETFGQKINYEKIKKLAPDVLILAGDIASYAYYNSVIKLIKEYMEKTDVKHVIHVCGNHEFYSGADEWLAHFETLGIHSFRNDHKILEKKSTEGVTEKLMVAGVYDLQGERFSEKHRTDPHKAAHTVEQMSCKILLAHNPRSIEEATKAGFHLQLSGHTHAGQFYPFTWIARLAHQYFEGLYRVNETTQIYVNRGTGFWGPPNRLGKTGEITHITLKRS